MGLDDRPSERLKHIRTTLKVTQKKLSEVLNCSQAKVSDYEAGKLHISNQDLSTIATVFNVDLTWLLTGRGEMFAKDRARGKGSLIEIPVVAAIAAGRPLEIYNEEPLEMLYLPATVLHLPPPYIAFKVEGESMSPYIIDGDLVVLSRDWRYLRLHNRICGFRTVDGITLKRLVLQPKNKTVWLMPLNHEYDPVAYSKDTDELSMFGVLILLIRKFT